MKDKEKNTKRARVAVALVLGAAAAYLAYRGLISQEDAQEVANNAPQGTGTGTPEVPVGSDTPSTESTPTGTSVPETTEAAAPTGTSATEIHDIPGIDSVPETTEASGITTTSETPEPPTPDADTGTGQPEAGNPTPGQPADIASQNGLDLDKQVNFSAEAGALPDGGNVWESSEQYWIDSGFNGSEENLERLTDSLKDWRLDQLGLSEADAKNMAVGTKLPMPNPQQLAEIIARARLS